MAEAISDINGFIEIKGNKLSKPGVFDYLGAEINAPEPDRIYQVFRPPEELQDTECVNSFKLQPWVIDHKMLGKNYDSPAEAKGIHGVIGEDVYYDDSDGWLKGNIKIFSDTLEEEIAEGKDELSLGFGCVYEFDVTGTYGGKRYNVIQRNIRGNHLASVDESRMDVAVMDSAMDHLTVKINPTGAITMPQKKAADSKAKTPAESGQDQEMSMSDMMGTMKEMMPMMKEMGDMMCMMKEMMASMGGGMEGEVDKPAMEQEYMYKEEEPGMDQEGPEEERDKEKGMDTAALIADIKTLKAELATLKQRPAGMDSSALMQELSGRDDLAQRLSRFVGTFDHASKSLKEVAEYGVEKLEIPCQKGQEVSALQAFMHNRKAEPAGLYTTSGQDSSVGATELVNQYVNGGDR